MEDIRELIERTARRYSRRDAFIVKNDDGSHRHISYIRFLGEAKSLGEKLIDMNMKDDRIAIIGKNSYEWFLVNVAVQLSGNVSVPLDRELKKGEMESCLIRSGAKMIFCDKKTEPLVREVVSEGRTEIEYIYTLYNSSEKSVYDLVWRGKMLIGASSRIDEIEIDSMKTSFMLFTSGTTSESKIVMLSQYNIYKDTTNVISCEDLRPTDVNIALLPYHHTLGAIAQWLMLGVGGCTVYCDGLKHLQQNMKEYKVTIFLGVPLILETMYKRILKTIRKNGLEKKVGTFRKIGHGLNKVGINAGRLIFKGVVDSLGGALRLVVVGGAPCDPEVIRGFADFGIETIQGYGLTETAPIIAAEQLGAKRIGSVGKPIPECDIAIEDPDEEGRGEIVVHAPNVMQGYYQNEEATAEVLKAGGWFHTGDLGYFDEDGFLYLTGRKKNVIVLKNGKNVFPEEMEVLIASLPYVVDNIIVGLPNNGDQIDLVVSTKIEYDPAQFEGASKDEIYEKIKADVEKINDTMPAYKRIKRIFITDEPMIKTSTGKVRRFKEVEKMLEEEAGRVAK